MSSKFRHSPEEFQKRFSGLVQEHCNPVGGYILQKKVPAVGQQGSLIN